MTWISEWFTEKDERFLPGGSPVELQPLVPRGNQLILRFMDEFGFGIELELESRDLFLIVELVTTQREFKHSIGGYNRTRSDLRELPKNRITEWFMANGTYIPEPETKICLTRILVDARNVDNELYVFRFDAVEKVMAIELRLNKTEVDRLLFFVESRAKLLRGSLE